MASDTYASGSAASPVPWWRRLVALAADDLLVTLSVLVAFALLTGLTGLQFTGEDPTHENDALAYLFVVPVMGMAIGLTFWLTSRDGRTPGSRLVGCRLAARSPTTEPSAVTGWYWIALVWLPMAVFAGLFLSPAFAGLVAVAVAIVVVAASVVAYGWPTGDHHATWIEHLIGGSFEHGPPDASADPA
jgi:uncharacterized RDD family membrane protein YckC